MSARAAALVGLMVASTPAAAINHLMADDMIGSFRVNGTAYGAAYLAEPKGLTVYTFDKDPSGVSSCIDACAQEWPPVLATPADLAILPFTIIIRADGKSQWAYEGKPLYRNAKDTEPGHTNGDGADGAWHLVPIRAHEM